MVFERLKAQLELDTSGFKGGVKDAQSSMDGLKSKAQSMGQSMQTVGAGLTAGITAPVALVGTQSVRTASRIEELQAKSEAVFGSMTEDIRSWARETAEATNRSQYALEETATGFQDLLIPMGLADERAADMSKQLTQLATDLSSFHNISQQRAASKLQSALMGETEAVRDFGVDVRKAAVEQELMNEGLAKSYDEATRAERAQARLNIMLEETQAAHGNAADTSDSFANQVRGMRAELEEVRLEIGQALLPVAKDLVGAISTLSGHFSGLSERQTRLAIGIGAVAAALGPLLLAVGTALTLLPQLSAAAGALGTALTVLTGPIGLVVAAIGLLAAAWVKDWGNIRERTFAILNQIEARFGPYLDLFRTEAVKTIRFYAQVFQQALQRVGQIWNKHGDTVMAVVKPLFDFLMATFEMGFDNMISIVSAALALMRGDWDRATTIVENLISRHRDRLENFANELTTRFMDALPSIQDLKEHGRGMMTALADGIKSAASAPVNAVQNAAQDMRDKLPGSDAKEGPLSDLTASGRALPETVAQGAEGNMDSLESVVSGLPGFGGQQQASGGGTSPEAIRDALAGMQMTVQGEFDVESGMIEIVRAELDRVSTQADNRGLTRFTRQ